MRYDFSIALDGNCMAGEVAPMSKYRVPVRIHALKIGAQTVGALGVGALAVGALAIRALAIGRVAIGRSQIRRLASDELVVEDSTSRKYSVRRAHQRMTRW